MLIINIKPKTMSETLTSRNTVTLNDAKEWTKLWQGNNPNHCKAFLVPAEDLTAVLKEMNILVQNPSGDYILDESKLVDNGVRAYMGIDTTDGTGKDNGYGEKLVIVGTTYDNKTKVHSDIIKNPLDPNNEDSGIYDFTEPCPSECDQSSPLYNPK